MKNIEFGTYFGFVFGIGYKNTQPRKKYKNSDESIVIFLPFIMLMFEWSRKYKTK